MDIATLIDAVESEGRALADAATGIEPGAEVPTCPEWKLRDLVRHQGNVHRWANGYVSLGRVEPMDDDTEAEVFGPMPDDGDLIDWFTEGHRVLVESLRAAPDDLQCWTFLPAPSPLAFWARRQAHENAIHRADAYAAAAAGRPSTYDAALAADGIDELLSGIVVHFMRKLRADKPTTMMVNAQDTGDRWLLRISPDPVVVTKPTGTMGAKLPPHCGIEGSASDVYLRLWNRIPVGEVIVTGDPSVLQLFSDKVHLRWG